MPIQRVSFLVLAISGSIVRRTKYEVQRYPIHPSLLPDPTIQKSISLPLSLFLSYFSALVSRTFQLQTRTKSQPSLPLRIAVRSTPRPGLATTAPPVLPSPPLCSPALSHDSPAHPYDFRRGGLGMSAPNRSGWTKTCPD